MARPPKNCWIGVRGQWPSNESVLWELVREAALQMLAQWAKSSKLRTFLIPDIFFFFFLTENRHANTIDSRTVLIMPISIWPITDDELNLNSNVKPQSTKNTTFLYELRRKWYFDPIVHRVQWEGKKYIYLASHLSLTIPKSFPTLILSKSFF